MLKATAQYLHWPVQGWTHFLRTPKQREDASLAFRIPERYLDCTVFLYPDDASARRGDRAGGSGFAVGTPCPEIGKDFSEVWLVTNKHIIEQGAWTVRLNTVDGGFDTIDTDETEWIFHPDHDLAVRPFFLRQDRHKTMFLGMENLLTQEKVNTYEIGPGDPAFVVGRFVNHEGRQRNTPTVRFGQIAQSPVEKIVAFGMEQESFLVEIRSIGGFSGSPVFVYLDSTYDRPDEKARTKSLMERLAARRKDFDKLWLLGIDWCMVPSWELVHDHKGDPLPNNWQVPVNTGMMGVIPAWHLHWLLMEHEPVVKLRKELTEARLNKLPTVMPTSASSSAPPDSDENPKHREDFNRLLDVAARKPKQDG